MKFSKIWLTALILPLLFSFTTQREFTKTINKEFDISASGTVDLQHRKGKTNVHIWNQNKVKIDVTIRVETTTEAKANQVFERISPEFENSSSLVKSVTKIQDKSKWKFWNWNSKDKYHVDYEIYMPASVKLNSSISYGFISIPNIENNLNVKLRYSDMKAADVNGTANLDFAYSHANIANMGDADIDMRYSDLTAESADDVHLDAGYSKINLANAETLNADSRYSDLVLGEVGKLNLDAGYGSTKAKAVGEAILDGRYTDFSFESMSGRGDFDLSYSDVKIGGLSNSFGEISADGNYSDVIITLASGTGFKLEASTKYGSISVPSGFDSNYDHSKSGSQTRKGTFGNGNGTISIELSYGGLKIK
jgi:hypothetical protein